MFSELIADPLRQSVKLIVARLTAPFQYTLGVECGKGQRDGVPPGSSCTVSPVLVDLQAWTDAHTDKCMFHFSHINITAFMVSSISVTCLAYKLDVSCFSVFFVRALASAPA